VRSSVPSDVDTILAWRSATAAWLAEHHQTDQWQIPYPRKQLELWVQQGATFMAMIEPDGDPVGTITVSPTPEDGLWTIEEQQIPARYISKTNVRIDMHGHGIGEALITWARGKAAAAGADVIRFDVWSTNTSLHQYYVRQGFRHVRTVPGRSSGALFEGPSIRDPAVPVVELEGVQVA
jgi:GNAT superfamily N-acetyltransferase